MSGLDRITGDIIKNARAIEEKNLSGAKKVADEILKNSKAEIDKKTSSAMEFAEKEAQKIKQMSEAQDKQELRQILLKTKSEIIEDIINEAKNSLINLPDNEYFDMLKKLFQSNCQDCDGEILFCKKDLDRLPKDFIKECNSYLKNGKITLSKDIANIESGFIIRYGKIEQNCSLESIFVDKESLLQDEINNFLTKEG